MADSPSLPILIGIRVRGAWWACWYRKVYGKESQSISRHLGSVVCVRELHTPYSRAIKAGHMAKTFKAL